MMCPQSRGNWTYSSSQAQVLCRKLPGAIVKISREAQSNRSCKGLLRTAVLVVQARLPSADFKLCCTLHASLIRQPPVQTWWTIDARAPEPSSEVESQMERALAILTQLIGMKLLVGPCRSLLDLFYA
eukprot:1159965-Pelagomonas_calceolata.AAC.9